MKRALTVYCLVMALIGSWLLLAALNCYKIGWDLRWHKAQCWSNEFLIEDGAPIETPEPTYIYPTVPAATLYPTWTWQPTDTSEPYPWPTFFPIPPYP